jgi:hypothetical protein
MMLLGLALCAVLPLPVGAAVNKIRFDPPPNVPADNTYFRKGLLDVTLFGADPSGAKDSTQAIQKAVDTARDYQLATFFPSGTYLVTDTINAFLPGNQNGFTDPGLHRPTILVGSRRGGKRPLLRLQRGLKAFADPNRPKPVLLFWAGPGHWMPDYGSTDPLKAEDDISFFQAVSGIDIDLGGNPGAYGIRHPGAQGALVENVRIEATGAFAGLGKYGVYGAAHYNVEVMGGRYAVYSDPTNDRVSPYSGHGMYFGCDFRRQEKAVFYLGMAAHPVLLAGVHLEQAGAVLSEGYVDGDRGGISLVDSVLETEGGQFFPDGKNLFLRNVYLRGVETVANGWRIEHPKGWTRIEQYAFATGRSANLVVGTDGKLERPGEVRSKVEDVTTDKATLVATLLRTHRFGDDVSPWFEDADAVDARQLGVRGDDDEDDTDALEKVLAEHDKVFLPKGLYFVRRTLTLRSRTQLFGVSASHTWIMPHTSWKPSSQSVIVETADDPQATTVLAHISVNDWPNRVTQDSGAFTPVHWRAGRDSVMKNVFAGNLVEDWGQPMLTKLPRFWVSGGGGGRHFQLWAGTPGGRAPAARGIFIDQTTEPLFVYAFNAAAEPPDTTDEIAGAKNVFFYYPTHEGGQSNIRIRQSDNVAVYSCLKNGDVGDKRGVVEVIDSENVVVSPISSRYGWRALISTSSKRPTATACRRSGTTLTSGSSSEAIPSPSPSEGNWRECQLRQLRSA